ncbi:MAG: hypothetical protein ACT4O0_12985 [Pseudonocardia sp.]
MSWRPECGWPALLGKWTVAAGAGAALQIANLNGVDSTLTGLDPRTVREVELPPDTSTELQRLIPVSPAAPGERSGTTPGAAGETARDSAGGPSPAPPLPASSDPAPRSDESDDEAEGDEPDGENSEDEEPAADGDTDFEPEEDGKADRATEEDGASEQGGRPEENRASKQDGRPEENRASEQDGRPEENRASKQDGRPEDDRDDVGPSVSTRGDAEGTDDRDRPDEEDREGGEQDEAE